MYIPQDKLLDGVLDFFAERVLGPERRNFLAADLDRDNDSAFTAWQEELVAIERTLVDLDTRRGWLIEALETTDDPTGALAQDVNRRLAEIAQQQHAKVGELQHTRAHPPQASTDGADLLDRIGVVSYDDLQAAPDQTLRHLFDSFALTVTYDARDHMATWRRHAGRCHDRRRSGRCRRRRQPRQPISRCGWNGGHIA